MSQIDKLRTDFKNADEAFKNGLAQLTSEFQKHQQEETGKVSLDDGFLDKQPSDFGLFYCLSESLWQIERCIAEKPSRELSLVKTKLQEAMFWARQS
jgi:hypothetical protein